MKLRIAELVDLRFGFLNADKISVLFAQPVEKTFARCGADTVNIYRDDPHQFQSPKKLAIIPFTNGLKIRIMPGS